MYVDQFGELIICKWISGLKRIKNPTGKWRTWWLCILQVCLGSRAWASEKQIQSSAWSEAKNQVNSNPRLLVCKFSILITSPPCLGVLKSMPRIWWLLSQHGIFMENSLTEVASIWVLTWYWKKFSLHKKCILIVSNKLILWLCVLLKQPVTNGIPWERRNFKTQSFGFEKGM